MARYTYPHMKKKMGDFRLEVHAGDFTDSEILVMLGENGTGKTTFIRMMAGRLAPDEGAADVPQMNVSYKPQKISPKSTGTVRQLLHEKIRDAYIHPQVRGNGVEVTRGDGIEDGEDGRIPSLSARLLGGSAH